MVSYTGTGGFVPTYSMPESLKSELRAFSKKRISTEYINELLKKIELGVQMYLSTHDLSSDHPSPKEIIDQIEEFRDMSLKLADLLSNIHVTALDAIEQEYLLKYKKYSFITTLNKLDSECWVELKKHARLCDSLIQENTVTRGRPAFSNIKHIAQQLDEGLQKYGLKKYKIRADQRSVFVLFLDIILKSLSQSTLFGKQNYIHETPYSKDTARSLARSYINHKYDYERLTIS